MVKNLLPYILRKIAHTAPTPVDVIMDFLRTYVMKKTPLFVFLCLLSLGNPVIGQKISQINFDEIYKNISTPSSAYFYPTLLARYEKNDTTLTTNQYKHLYYGFTRQPTYLPYEKDEKQKEFNQLINEKAYEKAIVLGKEGLKRTPFNMNYIFGLYYAYENLQKTAEARRWLFKFEHLFDVLQQSGNGKTPATAFVVIAVGDEQIYLETLGLRTQSRDVISGCDKVVLQEPTEAGTKELYFNIEKLGLNDKKASIKKK